MAKKTEKHDEPIEEKYVHEDKYIGGKLVEDDKPDEVMPLDADACRQMAKTLRAYAEWKGMDATNAYVNAASLLESLAEETES